MSKLFCLLAFLLVFSLQFADAETQADINRRSLKDFYNALNGDKWVHNDGWLIDTDYCNWYGIFCDLPGYLTRINMTFNNMRGELPDSFQNLTTLAIIDWSGNGITGPLPTYFCNMDSILYFYVQFNEFSGAIPDCWKPTSKIALFGVQFNQLTGGWPKSIKNMKNLQFLDLSQNFFEGPLDEEFFCIAAPNMIALGMAAAGFTGRIPPCIVNWNLVQFLVMNLNQLEGPIPPGLFQLPSLTHLVMDNNYLSGTIPDTFPTNSNLRQIWAGFNNLTGTLPASLGNIKALRTIRFDHNHLVGNIPSTLLDLPKLALIQLDYNQLTGELPGAILNCTSLVLSHNQLSGSIEVLTEMTRLERIDLSYNNFTGSIPFNILLYSSRISLIDLSHNNLGGLFPALDTSNDLFGKVPNSFPAPVNYIDFSHNNLVGSIGLAFLPQLTSFKVNNNKLTGFIPLLISDLLEEMDFSNNQMFGPIPSPMALLKNLNRLVLDNNEFYGTFPENFGLLKTLKYFSSSNNRFTGNFEVLTSLDSIEHFNISHNLIEANIPSGIGGLQSIQKLDVSHNRISGEIPPGLFSIRSLTDLRLSNNQLTGSILRFESDPDTIDLSNNQFEGDMDWLADLTAINHLNISHNKFMGKVDDMSSYKKVITVDLSHNQLSDELPDLRELPRLKIFKANDNQFVGEVSDTTDDLALEELDLSNNKLTDISTLTVFPNLKICKLDGNQYECPISNQAYDFCGARCVIKSAESSSTASIRIRYTGEISSFDRNSFITKVSAAANITSSRTNVIGTSSGSIIADVEFGPPASGTNEGSAPRVVSFLSSSKGKEALKAQGIDVLEVGPIPGKAPLTTAQIIGIAVGVLVFILLAMAILSYYLIRRSQNQLKHGLYEQTIKMIDLESIPLGEAKNSIIPYDTITNMHQIGQGAFGVVFRARWRELDVAVKQIRAEHVSAEQLKDFLHEVAILQGLRKHPNVVLFLAVTFPPDPLSLITEFCEGGGLYDYLRDKPTTPEQKFKMIQGIALGMLHLHSEKIVHRDLACRNILLTKYYEPKVSDFGLSRETQSTDSASVTAQTTGPLKWMSPEAIRNSTYSNKSDVFSFAVTCWEILTVSDPFPTMTPVEAAFAVCVSDTRLEIPKGIDPLLENLINDCWKTDPEERPDFSQICARLAGDHSTANLTKTAGNRQTVEFAASATNNYGQMEGTFLNNWAGKNPNSNTNNNNYAKMEGFDLPPKKPDPLGLSPGGNYANPEGLAIDRLPQQKSLIISAEDPEKQSQPNDTIYSSMHGKLEEMINQKKEESDSQYATTSDVNLMLGKKK